MKRITACILIVITSIILLVMLASCNVSNEEGQPAEKQTDSSAADGTDNSNNGDNRNDGDDKSDNEDILISAQDKLNKVKVTESNVGILDESSISASGMTDDQRSVYLEYLKEKIEAAKEDVTYYDGNNYFCSDEDGNTILFQDVLYIDMPEYDIKYKMVLPSGEGENGLESLAAELGFENGLKNYESYEITNNSDGSVTIRAVGSKNNNSLADMFSGEEDTLGGAINYDSEVLTLDIVIEIDAEGRYQRMYQKCTVKITMQCAGPNDEYSSMFFTSTKETEVQFDYVDVMTVNPPEDANEYLDYSMLE